MASTLDKKTKPVHKKKGQRMFSNIWNPAHPAHLDRLVRGINCLLGVSIAPDKCSYQVNIILISPWKHMLWLCSTPPHHHHHQRGGTFCFWDGSRWCQRRCKTFCPLCNLNTLWYILMILGRNVDQDEMACRIQDDSSGFLHPLSAL